MTALTKPAHLRLPAYGADVIADRRAGRHGCHGLMYVALDWPLFHGRRDRVVLPPDLDAASVHWTPIVAGLDVQLLQWHGDDERAAAIVRELLPFCRGLHRRSFDETGAPVDFEVIRSALPADWPGCGVVA